MTAHARKPSAQASPVSSIAVEPQIDGTDLHSFTVDGVIVHVRAVRLSRIAAAETLVARLHEVCAQAAAGGRP